jgi:hypothetical protein
MNRYTSLQAREVVVARNVSIRAATRGFLERFVRQGGWRMGRRGLRLSLLFALYQWLLFEKSDELTRGGEPGILAGYEELAAATIEGRPMP